jgi:hypothetical protein
VAKADVVGEHLEQSSVVTSEPQPRGGRRLRIQVDVQDAVPMLTQGGGEVDGGFWSLTAMVRKAYLKTNAL